ncbi:MAG: segregation/condensation protein A [Candidatus Marinimicrobia bacterium]|nr:segregation/condensation protein A [Candidatus Neomarinimicrobiota bacterium]MBT4369204.1 segregation/condensation protein A [Candidatus Neomarinimicrobiota bacterium]MBT4662755.1 segregation/condensation protein A [Candidatus Neomarinimicrobiota bacterium]MBT5225383.1 segregation/condensation protein A [Candidatus Neomarinimicrobiota bacterium]MBT6516374.1 segregation/condensation protein A [Candidatus Neomarinimicrobiota bacterium]
MAYQVKLENFEGPMDLLLYFIRRDELDIYDIPIGQITKDFVDMIEEWKRMNMLIAGEFIVMAASLMRVKAKMMIPRPELDDEGVIIDPRTELMQQLIDYKRFRDAAEMLDSIAGERSHVVPRQFEQDIKVLDGDEIGTLLRDVTLYDLARVFKEAMENRPVMSQFELSREPIKLEQQKEFLFKYFDGDGRLKFSTLLKNIKTRLEIIVTFLAILDLVREGTCTFEQNDVFDDIELIHLGAVA